MTDNTKEIHPEDKELINDYISGMNYKQILSKHELINIDELYLILNEYNIPLRRSHDSINARNEKIYSLHKKGYSTREIMSFAGVTKSHVYYVLHKFGVDTSKPELTEAQKERHEKIYELYKNGHSAKEISALVNLSQDRVYKVLYKRGAKFRERG